MSNNHKEGDSSKWILDSVEIDQITDAPNHNESSSSSSSNNNNHNNIPQKSPRGLNFSRIGSNTKKRFGILGNGNANGNGNSNAAQPKMGRMRSTAARGLQSLRFLDGATGKDGDAWKPVEKRFKQNAVNGRVPRDKFSAVIGKPFAFFFFYSFLCVALICMFVP